MFNWGIVIKDSNELIGAMGAFPSEDGRYEIGYNIAKNIGTMAIQQKL